jgi:serine/threonine protein kinase
MNPDSESEDALTEIDGHGSPDTELDTRLSTGNEAAADPASAAEQLGPGSTIKERFELESSLGSGGMGSVFRARDLRKVEAGDKNPWVALKVITGSFASDPRAFVALHREAEKSQTLAHPNIITVYDFDREGDLFFMTMESLEGETLASYIRREDRALADCINIIGEIANGIAYAHKRNIVHSDLKPQNIFITTTGEVKILDFGIARAFSDLQDSPADDEIRGLTPAYASCEMIAGESPHPADDVYAIGLIAYEVISGAHPFERLQASQAKAQSLVPGKLKTLKGYQWHAIADALTFDRVRRPADASEFYKRFTGSGRRVRMLSAALALSFATLAGFLLFYEPDSGPELPFEELAPDVRQEVLTNLAEGKQALQFADYNGAIFYLDQAYTLHPRNEQVMEQLDLLVAAIAAQLQGMPAAGSGNTGYEQVSELLKYPSLQQNMELVKLKKSLEP